MLRGGTRSAAAMVATAVLRIAVSSDSMNNATANSNGNNRVLGADSRGSADGSGAVRPIFALAVSGRIGLS